MPTKKTSAAVMVLTVIMTFMEMSALPAALFVNISFLDVPPVYFVLMVNFCIAFALCWIFRKFLIKDWHFGLELEGTLTGLKQHGLPAVIATVLAVIAFCIGLPVFDNTPTLWRVLIEGVIYYIGVGIMEELYLRGLLQNLLEKWFSRKENSSLLAIFITSILFGLGHIFGALSQPLATIVCKVIWATALGVYFGAVYVKTRKLWVPIILHLVINLCGIPYCFTTSTQYPTIALITCLSVYLLLAVYGVHILKKKP